MATTREIIKRRDSVSNICKITKTMEMIATSKFKKAHQQSGGSRPYTDAVSHLVGSLAAHNDGIEHPLLRNNRHTDDVVVIVLTSNRGLCGAFNDNVIKLAEEQLEAIKKGEHLIAAQGDSERSYNREEEKVDEYKVDLRVVGKKGISYFKKSKYELN